MMIRTSRTGGYIAIQRVRDSRGDAHVAGWGETIRDAIERCLELVKGGTA